MRSDMYFTPADDVEPPSTGISAPVTYAAASDNRKTTTRATSSGLPKRSSGVSSS